MQHLVICFFFFGGWLISLWRNVYLNLSLPTPLFFFPLAESHGWQDLNSWPGSEPVPSTVKAESPNHWTGPPGKSSLCPFFNQVVWFCCCCVRVLYIFWILISIRCMIWKDFLPFHRLSFNFVDYLKSDEGPLIYWCVCFLCFWCYIQETIVKSKGITLLMVFIKRWVANLPLGHEINLGSCNWYF